MAQKTSAVVSANKIGEWVIKTSSSVLSILCSKTHGRVTTCLCNFFLANSRAKHLGKRHFGSCRCRPWSVGRFRKGRTNETKMATAQSLVVYFLTQDRTQDRTPVKVHSTNFLCGETSNIFFWIFIPKPRRFSWSNLTLRIFFRWVESKPPTCRMGSQWM